MAGEFVLSSNYLADSGSLASGFADAALGGTEAFSVIGVLEANDGVILSANPTFSDLLIAYKQAVAFGNQDRMKQFGAEIARIIREHATAFNRLLKTLPHESTHEKTRRFGSATDVRNIFIASPAFLPTHRVEKENRLRIEASAAGVRDDRRPRPAAVEEPSVESGLSSPVAEFPLPAPVAHAPTPAVSTGTPSFQNTDGTLVYYDAKFIGTGGEAEVFRVKDAGGKTFVAKVSHISFKTEAEAKPFVREVEALTRVNHPNVIKCYNTFVERDERRNTFKVVLIMEYVEGKTLKDVVELTRRRNPLSETEILEIWHQIDAGLEAMHTANVVHRDIKPSNVMIGRDEAGHAFVKIFDAGLAKLMDQDTHTESQGIGSLQWMAPEQRGGDPDLPEKYRARVGPWSDLYSEGLLVLYLATHGKLQRDFSDARPLLQRIDKFFPKDRFTPAFTERMKAFLDPDPDVRMQGREALRKPTVVDAVVVAREATEVPATVAMVSAAQYLEGLRAGTREPSGQKESNPLDPIAIIVGGTLLFGSPFAKTFGYALLALVVSFLGYGGYKLHRLHRYGKLNPPALYDLKTGEVMAPTLARFKQGAVPLYPVDKREDIYNLPVGSHVLLKGVPIRNVRIDKDDFHISCWLDFSGKNDRDGLFAYYYPKSMEEAVAIAEALKQENVTFVGTITENIVGHVRVAIRGIKIVQINPLISH